MSLPGPRGPGYLFTGTLSLKSEKGAVSGDSCSRNFRFSFRGKTQPEKTSFLTDSFHPRPYPAIVRFADEGGRTWGEKNRSKTRFFQAGFSP